MPANPRIARARGILAAALCIAWQVAPAASAADDCKNILVINSYLPSVNYTHAQVKAIDEGIRKSISTPVYLYLEYLGANINAEASQQKFFAQVLKQRYEGIRIDLLMTTDTPAVDFMNAYGKDLFPGVPLVYSGLIADHPGFSEQPRRIVGVREPVDVKEVIELILRLHPSTRRIAFLCDSTDFGLRLKARAGSAAAAFGDRLSFEWIEGLPFESLRARLANLGSDTIPVFLSYSDANLVPPPVYSVLTRITAASARPMYGLYDTTLGAGIVGGKMAGAESQGRAAAEWALRVLRGRSDDQVPGETRSPNLFIFDWRELKRWGIPETALPPDSIVRFRPDSVLARFSDWIIPGLVLLFVEALIIALLLVNRRRRIRAEQTARTSERFVTSILDSLTAHVAVLDATGRIISVNTAWRRFAEENGLSSADHGVGADYLHVCETSGVDNAPEARHVAHAIRQLMGGQLNDFRLAYPCHSPDRQRWFQTHLRRLRCPEDAQYLIVVAHEEITELHTISEALHRSEEKYRRLVEGMGVIVWEADPTTFACTYVSARAETLLGFPAEDWYRPGFWLDHIHPEDRDRVDASSRERVARFEDHRLEYRMIAADDGILWFEDLVSVEVRHGKVSRIRGVMIDITERKNAELALAAGKTRLRAILDSEPECVKTVSPDGRLLEMNAAGLRMIEADSFEQVRETSVLNLVHPQDRPTFSSLHQAALEGRPASAQFRIIGIRGTQRWMDSSAVPLRDPGGQIDAVLSLTRDITARREIEMRLRESEHRYRELFEENMAGVFYSTTTGRVQGCNQAFARIFGFDSPDAAMSVPAADFYLHPDDRSRYIEELRRAGRLTSYEIRMRRRDGTPLWLLENVQLLPGADDNGDFIFGTFIDITARKQAEQALAESEERFRGIFEHADVGIARVSTDGRFRQVNPALCRMLGYAEADVLGRTFASLTHPDDISPNMDLFHQALRGERDNYRLEKRYLRADGGVVWASLTVVAIHDESGRTTGFIPVIEDITARKRAEAELMEAHELLEQRVRDRTSQLAESEERFRALHEAAFEGLAICEGEIIREANEALVDMFGFSREELLGRTVFSLIAPESREDAEAADAVGEPASADASEFLGLHRSGRFFPIEFRTKEMPFRGGRARVIAIRDISARRRAEEAVERHREELAHLQRLATANELATGLAHEINQPLCSVVNYVSGCVNRLRADPACGAELVGVLRQAVAQAERASGIVRWMREFVRKRSIAKAAVDLNRVVERAAGMIRREAAQLGISVRLRLQSDLPPVPVDEIQIEQVVLNLLKNACEALADAPAGRRLVMLTTDSLPGLVRLQVSDTGRGIDLPLAARIFEPFVSSKAQGMGLGLSISRSIVEAHGGRLTFERGLEEGTVFLLTLPVQFQGASDGQHHRSDEANRLHCG